MNTEVLKISPDAPEPEAMRKAARVIAGGGLVAFPTETVYGLGADAFNRAAFEGIYRAKGRPADNPLIMHIADASRLDALAAEIPDCARAFAKAFWPGPLTMVFRKDPSLPDWMSAGLKTISVRMPSSLVARRLIERSGCVIAAPSANSSGKPSPTNAARVYEDLNGKIDMILDGGPAEVGLESTVLDVSAAAEGAAPVILRPGAVTKEMLEAVCGLEVRLFAGESPERPASPGMKYRHYAPKAEVVVVAGELDKIVWKINALVSETACKTGILATDETAAFYDSAKSAVISAGSRARPETVAAGLFEALRRFDEAGAAVVYAEALPEDGIGAAIMNRMVKAAGGRVVKA